MSNERAFLWMTVTGLIALALLVGQTAAVSVAALVAAYIVYRQAEQRPEPQPASG
jgi:hypothetical protein